MSSGKERDTHKHARFLQGHGWLFTVTYSNYVAKQEAQTLFLSQCLFYLISEFRQSFFNQIMRLLFSFKMAFEFFQKQVGHPSQNIFRPSSQQQWKIQKCRVLCRSSFLVISDQDRIDQILSNCPVIIISILEGGHITDSRRY